MANAIAYLGPVVMEQGLGQEGFYWVRATLDGSNTACVCTSFPASCPIKTIRGVIGPQVKNDIPFLGVALATGFTVTTVNNGTNGEFVDFLVFGDPR